MDLMTLLYDQNRITYAYGNARYKEGEKRGEIRGEIRGEKRGEEKGRLNTQLAIAENLRKMGFSEDDVQQALAVQPLQ